MSAPAVLPGPAPITGAIVCADGATRVRSLSDADEPFCRALFHSVRAAPFAPLGLPAPVLAALLDQQFRAQLAGYRQAFPAAEHLLVEHGGVPAGRLIVACDGTALHLVDILLAVRGCGLGTDVITSLARAARAKRVERFTLTVSRTNDSARRLYERLG